jgi:predicted phosphodiesterase
MSMRTAIISDIHANLPALEAVLKNIGEQQADRIFCLGDIVGYGPFPNECVELVRKHCVYAVRGNHDSGLTGETSIEHFNRYGQEALRWTRDVVTPQNLDYLRALPLLHTEGDITIVHASPMNPGEWTYVLTMREAIESFEAFDTLLCFIGHTHLPVIVGEDLTINLFKPGMRHLINVGSVGQPRDGNPASAYGILDEKEQRFTLCRVEYDVKKTSRAIRSAGLPSYLAKRLARGI